MVFCPGSPVFSPVPDASCLAGDARRLEKRRCYIVAAKFMRKILFMKIVLIAFLFGASAFSQNSPSACGSENVTFKVTLDKSHPSLPNAEPGKAMVVFIQDFGVQTSLGVHPLTRIGVDGSWVGAIKDNSYSPVFLDPGERHICVDARPAFFTIPIELIHFTAEAGKVYYVRWRYLNIGGLFLAHVDSDEAKYQITQFPLSISSPKK
jgi:hypothetical protein